MTPERLAEIRNVFGKGRASYGLHSVSLGGEMCLAGTELLAEVDRLEALARSYQQDAHELRKRTGVLWEELDGLKATMARVRALANALDEAIARPLDSPPATKGNP